MKRYYLKNNEVYNNLKYNAISSGFFESKKSKFYSYVFYIENENMVQEYINKIKEDNKDAKHVVYIYSYFKDNNVCIKFSDDGEPQGTGTKAIYETIVKESITNVCIVIVRYFGGVLLGAGPLSRAYLTCAKDALDKCNKEVLYLYSEYKCSISYSDFKLVKNLLDKYVESRLVKIVSIEFTDKVEIRLLIENENFDNIILKINI